jgi:hypothetical protein
MFSVLVYCETGSGIIEEANCMSEMTIEQTPKPDTALQNLEVFVGKWNTEGEILDGGERHGAIVQGTDIYEWLAGGFFLVHHVDVRMTLGNKGWDAKSIEIIGPYDASQQTYPMHSFDNMGNAEVMQAKVKGVDIQFLGDTMRFNGKVSDNGSTISGMWEFASDGKNWSPWMRIKLTKAEATP